MLRGEGFARDVVGGTVGVVTAGRLGVLNGTGAATVGLGRPVPEAPPQAASANAATQASGIRTKRDTGSSVPAGVWR